MTTRIAAVIALTYFAAACGGQAEATPGAEQSEPIAVRVAAVADAEVSQPVIAVGTLGPRDEIALSFKIGGVVARVLVDAGERVRAGETLAELDLREIGAAVARAASAEAKAARDFERASRLFSDSVVPLSQLQDTETAAEIARADLETARFNLRYAVIRAPVDGVVLRRLAEPGEMLAPGAPVVTFGSDSRGAVLRTGLADRDVVRVRVGDAAVVTFGALPGRVFEGSVTEIAGAAEPATGTWPVEVALPTADGVAAGLVGDVEIRPSSRARFRVIPVEALLEADGGLATVFAVSSDGRRAERHRVTVAFMVDSRVAVSAGLEGVDAVVTDGAAWVDDGAAVKVVP